MLVGTKHVVLHHRHFSNFSIGRHYLCHHGFVVEASVSQSRTRFKQKSQIRQSTGHRLSQVIDPISTSDLASVHSTFSANSTAHKSLYELQFIRSNEAVGSLVGSAVSSVGASIGLVLGALVGALVGLVLVCAALMGAPVGLLVLVSAALMGYPVGLVLGALVSAPVELVTLPTTDETIPSSDDLP